MMNYNELKELLESRGLSEKQLANERKSFSFKNRQLGNGKKNVVIQVKELNDGSVNGYIYVNHRSEYDEYRNKTEEGYLPIKGMTKIQFTEILDKVVALYI